MPVELGDVCKRGHVIAGDNVQYYTNRGAKHIRCNICNQPPKQIQRKPGDTCKNGHVIEGANLGSKVLDNGRVQYFCRECKRNHVRKYGKTEKGIVANKRKRATSPQARERYAQKKAAERADELIASGKEDNALNYLKLSKRAERASIALHKAMLHSEPNCIDNPGPYIDYDEDDPPGKQEAYLMCADCPVLVECARFASAYRPPIGVWGGEAWKNGMVLYK